VTVINLPRFPIEGFDRITALMEETGRTFVALDQGFVKTRYDRDSFAKIASDRRQDSFGVILGLSREAFRFNKVRKVLEKRKDTTALVLKRKELTGDLLLVNEYTDVLPPRIALYLEPDVPDEFGEKARRLEELTKTVSEMKRQGLEIPPEARAELEELEQIWAKAKIFGKLTDRPGFVKVTVPTPKGMAEVSLRIEDGRQSLAKEIERLLKHLHRTMGVLVGFKEAAGLRDAIVRARAEGGGEARLRMRLIVRKEGDSFTVNPYFESVVRRERIKSVKEHLDFLGKLWGRSFLPAYMERRDGDSVAFEGFLTIRATFHPDVGDVPTSEGEGE
jgi:hypothetical protein